MKELLKTIAGILLFITIALGIISFVNNFNRQPSVILTNTICDPPCWNDISPGQTKASKVYAFLNDLEFINQDTILAESDRDGDLVSLFWSFQYPAVDSSGSVYFEDDLVTAISILTVNSVSNSLKLTDIVERYGHADEYWTEIGYGENREYLDVSLFYFQEGLLTNILIDIPNGANQVEIKPSNRVFQVIYYDPEMLQELLETRILIDKPYKARTGSFQDWPGYGNIVFERN